MATLADVRVAFRALDARSKFFFSACTTIVVCTVLHLLPLPLLSRRLIPVHTLSYRAALLCGLFAHGYRVFYSTALPKPLNAEAFQKLAASLAQSNSALSAVYCFLFLLGREVNLVLVPVGITALYQAMTILSKVAAQHRLYVKHGARAFEYLQSSMDKALAVAFMSEVMTGVLLLAQLFTPARQVPRCFVYWNLFLRARLACRDNTVFRIKFTQGSVGLYHGLVWEQVGGMAEPLIRRVPALQKVKQAAVRWFRGPAAPVRAG